MTDNEFKYLAFLGYSRQDNREQRSEATEAGGRCWGNWLHDALMSFSIPAEFVGQINGRGEIIPERIDSLFRAELGLGEQEALSTEMRQALEQSVCLVVICSPRSAQSRQLNEAVRYFKQLGRGKNILPFVVAGEPDASDGRKPGRSPADECFVPALRHPVQPDGTLDATRRAGKFMFVDARHGVEKREILANDHRTAEADLEMARIQLIALLLGVGFNGLWWREQKRHFIDFAEAHHQAREALNQVGEVRRQLQEARQQTRAAQQQALENQNLPRDVQGQIQAAQDQAREAQSQAREAQKHLQEFQIKFRDAQTQLEDARLRAIAAEGKALETEKQARAALTQLEETRHQIREAQNTQSQSEEFRQQAQAAQDKILAAQRQVQEFQDQARSAQSQLEAARQQVREAQGKALAAENQSRAAHDQVRKIQDQGRNARRLTRVFALLAVLALLSAGVALRQREVASQALTTASAEADGKFDPAAGGLEPVRQALQKFGGSEQAENRRRSFDHLAAGIPREEIPQALQAAAIIADDQQRSHFQKWLLVRLGWENPAAAMTCASAIEGNIVNDAGLADSAIYFQLAVLEDWMQTDLPGAFRWACDLPDADARQRAWKNIFRWVQSQPDSGAVNQALALCIGELAKTDVSQALALAESLPEGAWRTTVLSSIAEQADSLAALYWIKRPYWPQEFMQPREALSPWKKFLPSADFGCPAIFPVEGEISPNK
jgi:hypothetical protein